MDLKPFVVAGLALGYAAVGAAGAMIAWQLVDSGWAPGVAYVIAIVVATALSAGYGLSIGPLLAERETTVRSVGTLGFALALLGLMLICWSDDPRSTALSTDNSSFQLAGVQVTVTQAICLVLAIAVTAGVSAFLRRSQLGVFMRALADDRELSSVLGVRLRRVEAIAWSASGALAGITGILLASLVATDPNTLTFMVIPALAAATIGRFRSLGLTLAGGLVVGLLQSLATPYGSVTQYRNAAPFVVAIVALLVLQWRYGGIEGRTS
jgi:branched-chain amino acid transport system permease protein